MVDGLTPQDPMNAPIDDTGADGASPIAEEKKGLFSSPVAKVIGIVVAILVVLGVLGVLGFFVFTFFFVSSVQDDLQNQLEAVTTTATASVESTETVPTEPDPVTFTEVFTFRDIFNPLLKPPYTCDTSGSVESSATEGKLTADVSSETLYLNAIVVENGVTTAVMAYGGTEYRLTQGTGIPGTPWMVLAVNESSVTMLYGDQQVVLSVGQGTSR